MIYFLPDIPYYFEQSPENNMSFLTFDSDVHGYYHSMETLIEYPKFWSLHISLEKAISLKMFKEKHMTKSKKWTITAGCFLSYFLFGFINNMKGPVLPNLLSDMNYNYSSGGIIIFSEYTGFFISTFLAGLLADLFGQKFTLIIAGIFLIGGAIGYSASANLILPSGFIFFIGLGAGSLELSGSNIISGIHRENKGGYLNLLNAFYGIGSIIVPILVSILFRRGTSWRTVYRYSLFVIIPIILYFVTMEFPQENTFKRPTGKINPEEILHSILRIEVLLMYFVIFSYVAAEIGMASWLAVFLQKAKNISSTASSMYLSLYFAGMTAGRLLGSLFVDKIGYLKSLSIFSIMAFFCITIGIFGSPETAIILSLTGFCFSIIFPTSTAFISEIPFQHS